MNQIWSMVLTAVGVLLILSGSATIIMSRSVSTNMTLSGVWSLEGRTARLAVVGQGALQIALAVPIFLLASRMSQREEVGVAEWVSSRLHDFWGPVALWVVWGGIALCFLGCAVGLRLAARGFKRMNVTRRADPEASDGANRSCAVWGLVLLVFCAVTASFLLPVALRS